MSPTSCDRNKPVPNPGCALRTHEAGSRYCSVQAAVSRGGCRGVNPSLKTVRSQEKSPCSTEPTLLFEAVLFNRAWQDEALLATKTGLYSSPMGASTIPTPPAAPARAVQCAAVLEHPQHTLPLAGKPRQCQAEAPWAEGFGQALAQPPGRLHSLPLSPAQQH